MRPLVYTGLILGMCHATLLSRCTALEEFLELFDLEDLPCEAAKDFAEIKIALLSKGKPIGPYDMLIASHARHISATVVTNNEREFRRVPGLAVENWLKP